MIAAAPPLEPAAFFATNWSHAYDIAAQAHGSPIRIVDPTSCVHDGEAVYICKVTLHDRKTGAITCAKVTVGTDLTIFEVTPRHCLAETAE